MTRRGRTPALRTCGPSTPPQVATCLTFDKTQILFKLHRIKDGYYSHRNIYYDFCIAGQERVKAQLHYTVYAGCAVTAVIAAKFSTAYDRSRPSFWPPA